MSEYRHPDLWVAQKVVTNISQLFEELAVGWEKGSHENRCIMAGDMGQFIRLPENHLLEHPFHKKCLTDIAIDTGKNYNMKGFIKFESLSMFRGLFKTWRADDRAWLAAELTSDGVRFARAGVLDFNIEILGLKHYPFFNPAAREIIKDSALAQQQQFLR